MANGGYNTKQRLLILNYLIEARALHVTADDVFEHLKSQGNCVGKSTVYRYLDKLVIEGRLRKFYIEDGVNACYQYFDLNEECSSHYHLKCFECGALLHVECNLLDEIYQHVSSKHNFQIDNTKTVFYGLCEICNKTNNATHHID